MGKMMFFVYTACISILCLFVCGAEAQNAISLEYNAFRNHDMLYKQQVGYVTPGNDGLNVFWDFRGVDVLCESYKIEYFKDSDAVIREITPYAMDKYFFVADTLFLVGYETPMITMNYLSPLFKMKYPFAYGDYIVADYKGNGLFGNRNAIYAYGTVRVEADAAGRIVVSDNDTLDNVLRIHSIRTSSIGIERDTIVRDSTDRQLEIFDIYQWFVRGWRYPVFETYMVSYYHNTDLVSVDRTAFRYFPEEQEQLNDSINRKLLHCKLSAKERMEGNNINYEVSVNDGSIHINYSLQSDVRIFAVVSDVTGIVYRQESYNGQSGSGNIITINCSGLRLGEYILYLNVGGEIHSNKVKL